MPQLTVISAFAPVEEEVVARDDECRVARTGLFRCSTMLLGMLVFGGGVSVDLDRWGDVPIDPDRCRGCQPTCGRRYRWLCWLSGATSSTPARCGIDTN